MLGSGCGLSLGATDDGDDQVAPPAPTVSIEFTSADPDPDPPSETAGAGTLEVDLGDGAAETEYVIVAHVEGPSITTYSEPDTASAVVAELSNPTEIGGPLAFQALSPDAASAADWLEVYLPIRPNGTTGWIRRQDVTLSSNPYRIEIDVAAHQLRVYKANEPWLETPVAIGTGNTPTPIGRFYVIELLQPPDPDGAYGPYAFGLSGFSETLTEFAGGGGVIGIHGTNDPSSLGTDVSHGCVRMANEVISRLAGVLPLGTPVLIS